MMDDVMTWPFQLDFYIYISTDKQVTSRKPKTSSQKHPNRGKVLQAGVEWLVHQRELQRQDRSDNRQRKVTLQPLAVKHDINMKVNMEKEWMMHNIIHVFCYKQRDGTPLFTEDISNCFLNRNGRQVFSRLQSRLSSGWTTPRKKSILSHGNPHPLILLLCKGKSVVHIFFCRHQILCNLICTLNIV